ncbi:MAG TPA: hemerythrin domain-containing protein [Polaromonas sp.]|uniref:hemerythrin domain-containing protein n=1 Tax=Polaromonas sp. TaxID=1869339 RepID=UPI002D58492B|nr:hemerythrin domain-containing protein [Polaromonas sp.]HYW58773.1 hemerythrin domain-containing protein [Polaromonas sp.]
MTTSVAPSGKGYSSEPLTSFSQCHLGILSKLEAFMELPGLQAAAAQARTVANQTLALFRDAVIEHHADEERELFPAVLRSATRGKEFDVAEAMVFRLTGEHRQIEALWRKIEPDVRAVAKLRGGDLDLAAVEALVQAYNAHARYEEDHFLPMAQRVLGRNRNHMEALDLSLHLRHTPVPPGHI